jgi:hypothetical protein
MTAIVAEYIDKLTKLCDSALVACWQWQQSTSLLINHPITDIVQDDSHPATPCKVLKAVDEAMGSFLCIYVRIVIPVIRKNTTK